MLPGTAAASRTVVSGGQLVELGSRQPSPTSTGYFYPAGEVPALDNRHRGVLDPEISYQRQPNLRMVVDYIGSRGASVPLSAYRRDGDERMKLGDDTAIGAQLGEPYPGVGQARWLFDLFLDSLLWDRWCFVLAQAQGRPAWVRLPPRWWHYGPGLVGQRQVLVDVLGNAPIPAESVCTDGGRDGGVPQVLTLMDTLYELAEGTKYRNQLYRNGARMSNVIQRPLDAPEWSPEAKEKFRRSWHSAWAGDGPEAGGTPVLEDGMALAKADAFTPVDLQFIEGRQASLVEMCTFYHVAPELMGARPGTYSNIQAFRVGLYQETLGPVMVPFEQAITLQAARPMMDGDTSVYCEFNVEAMMRGTFEEQAQVLQAAVGAPYLTRNEARSLFNRPPIDEGDDIVTPLNVLVGGLASPRDTAPPLPAKGAKARDSRPVVVATERLAAAIRGWARQVQADVLPQLEEPDPLKGGEKAVPVLDYDEQAVAASLAARIRPHTGTAARHGVHGMLDTYGTRAARAEWSDDRLDPWLASQADHQGIASAVGLHGDLAATLTEPDTKSAARAVFAAVIGRSAILAGDLTAGAYHLGQSDGARVVGMRSKSWRVTSQTPRESHAALDGETVAAAESFSNGGRWPGDHNLPVEETAGCTCELDWSTDG